MREKLFDRNIHLTVSAETWDRVHHPVAQVQFPLIDENLNRRTGEWLGHGADIKNGVPLHCFFIFTIFPTERFMEDGSAVFNH